MPGTITLVVRRYDPATDKTPRWARHQVTVEPGDHLLDLLHRLKAADGTLTFRRSCGHGVCGSDVMRVNGKNRLACTARVDELGDPITVEPVGGLPVVKDLVVDTEPFFEQYRSVRPWLEAGDGRGEDGAERRQAPEQLDRIRSAASCILCAACTAACPIGWTNDRYVGPAALVATHRFVFDSRDEATGDRLDLVDEGAGVWGCRTAFECTDACPREIPVTESIQELKREALRRRF